jgi:hypothetical protein
VEENKNKNENMVSVATLAEHYGQYRWTLERDSARRFAGLWAQISASSLQDRDKKTLTNVIWALASLERAFQVLESDAKRAEKVINEGAPAVMTFLSGPYVGSLQYLLATGLWMDLGEVLAAYRTLQDRFGHLRRLVRRAGPLTEQDFHAEKAALEARRLPELGTQPIRQLATNVLHHYWHPTTPGVEIAWAWTGKEGEQTVNFTETGDLRESLFTVIGETVDQVVSLVRRLTA